MKRVSAFIGCGTTEISNKSSSSSSLTPSSRSRDLTVIKPKLRLTALFFIERHASRATSLSAKSSRPLTYNPSSASAVSPLRAALPQVDDGDDRHVRGLGQLGERRQRSADILIAVGVDLPRQRRNQGVDGKQPCPCLLGDLRDSSEVIGQADKIRGVVLAGRDDVDAG